MKIAFVTPCNAIAGGLFVVYRHAHYLQSIGHDVRIVFADSSQGRQVTWYPNFSVPVSLLAEEAAAPVEYDAVIATWWETYYDMFHLNARVDFDKINIFFFVEEKFHGTDILVTHGGCDLYGIVIKAFTGITTDGKRRS